MEYPFYIAKQEMGKLKVFQENNKLVMMCECEDPGNGLYKAYVTGTKGELLLGVMVPQNGKLHVKRQFTETEKRRYDPGTILSGRGELQYARKKTSEWREIRNVSALFSDPILIAAGKKITRALLKESEGKKYLAVKIGENKPFCLMPLFCFAKVEKIEGEDRAVFQIEQKAGEKS